MPVYAAVIALCSHEGCDAKFCTYVTPEDGVVVPPKWQLVEITEAGCEIYCPLHIPKIPE
jgi:hypothetical protein